jgi:hypothetical protein
VLTCLVILGPACTGDRVISEDELPELVLDSSDLPQSYQLFDEGPIGQVEYIVGPRGDPERFNRLGGWKARYRRTGEQDVSGALVIESRVDLFEAPEGAERDLGAYEEELVGNTSATAARRLEAPGIGDEAMAVTTASAGSNDSVRYFTIAWRSANASASIVVSGFEGRLSVDDALELARAQQQHIRAALE